MATTSIRIDRTTHQRLQELAERQHSSPDAVINELIDLYEEQEFRKVEEQEFRKAVVEGYARLRQDPEAWEEYKREFEAWDVTLMDGLENEPPYYDDEDNSNN
jgi:predicted transcriptional regulator